MSRQTSLPFNIKQNESTNSSGRRLNDFYPTTDAPLLVPPLMNALDKMSYVFLCPGTTKILEPCSGKLDIVNAIKSWDDDLYIDYSDINIDYPVSYHLNHALGFYHDATSSDYWNYLGMKYDWVITNPPFNLAMEILKLAFDHADTGVVMLLRLSFLEPTEERGDWLKDHEYNLKLIMPFNPRPQFRKGEINPKTGKEYGSDSVTTAWMVWIKDDWLESIVDNHSVYQPCNDWKV
jgi:hypothetical protein